MRSIIKIIKMSGFTVDEFVFLLRWEQALLVLILNETFSSEILLQ
jgi:hypothetical protein